MSLQTTGVPQAMAAWVDSLQLSKLQFLFMVNALFLILGCFLDVSVLLLVFVPMLLPAAKLLGVDLVHFGVLVVLNMMIGLIHPPQRQLQHPCAHCLRLQLGTKLIQQPRRARPPRSC